MKSASTFCSLITFSRLSFYMRKLQCCDTLDLKLAKVFRIEMLVCHMCQSKR